MQMYINNEWFRKIYRFYSATITQHFRLGQCHCLEIGNMTPWLWDWFHFSVNVDSFEVPLMPSLTLCFTKSNIQSVKAAISGRHFFQSLLFSFIHCWKKYILVKISKLPLDFVNRKSCCSQFYRIILSLTYTTVFNKPQYMHLSTNSTQNPVLIVMIRWYPYFSKSHLGHFRT